MSGIHIDNLHFWYKPGKIILKDINLDISDNEFIAIIGENGSGKTTLLKNICGLLLPSQGDIFINDKNLKALDISEIALSIGFMMQECDNQLFESSVYNEVAFALKDRALPKEIIRVKTEEALAAVGLSDKSGEYPPSLSMTDRIKTVFAVILAMDPKIIIMDEPVAGMDYTNSRKIMDITRNLHARGYIIILVSHNMNIIAEYAKRIIVMRQGSIILDGTPVNIFNRMDDLLEVGIIPPQITRLSHLLQKRIPHEENIVSSYELAKMLIAKIQ